MIRLQESRASIRGRGGVYFRNVTRGGPTAKGGGTGFV